MADSVLTYIVKAAISLEIGGTKLNGTCGLDDFPQYIICADVTLETSRDSVFNRGKGTGAIIERFSFTITRDQEDPKLIEMLTKACGKSGSGKAASKKVTLLDAIVVGKDNTGTMYAMKQLKKDSEEIVMEMEHEGTPYNSTFTVCFSGTGLWNIPSVVENKFTGVLASIPAAHATPLRAPDPSGGG